jgi:hypothetical protein
MEEELIKLFPGDKVKIKKNLDFYVSSMEVYINTWMVIHTKKVQQFGTNEYQLKSIPEHPNGHAVIPDFCWFDSDFYIKETNEANAFSRKRKKNKPFLPNL